MCAPELLESDHVFMNQVLVGDDKQGVIRVPGNQCVLTLALGTLRSPSPSLFAERGIEGVRFFRYESTGFRIRWRNFSEGKQGIWKKF